jgi:signal peptidase I
LKQAGELVAGSRRLMRIHRDLLDPQRVQEVTQATNDLEAAVKSRNIASVASLRARLETLLEKILPRFDQPAIRENVEVLLVAVIVAMAVRTFFFQPFKIPTGSMQPTLYGIVAAEDCDPHAPLLTRIKDGVVDGKWPQRPNGSLATSLMDFIGWASFATWNAGAQCVFSGDHIFVDRLTYHFRKPQRGEVVVFDTSAITDIGAASRGKFYIKRLIGLSGDKIEIRPPYVLVNDRILDGRPAFQRIYSRQDGYAGYVLFPPMENSTQPPKYINARNPVYEVPSDHLFVLGDNSRSSLDGRFWGSFSRHALVGRAVLVYWPFTKRFGAID